MEFSIEGHYNCIPVRGSVGSLFFLALFDMGFL